MKRIRTILSALGAAILILSSGWNPAAAQQEPSATLSLSHDSSGIGIGWQSGKGTLTFKDGSEYAVTMSGYNILGLGFADATSTGKVYNLQKPADFAGEYTGTGDSAAFPEGGGSSVITNSANGVRVDLRSTETGYRAQFGPGAVTFRVGERLKGPNMPPVASATPRPAVQPAMAPQPVKYTLLFGFDKSRVTLATGRELDALVTRWKKNGATYRIVGHADMVGTAKYNMLLSQKRAEAIKAALIQRGVPADKITAVGLGQKELAVQTGPGKRLRANRRVVLTVIGAK